MRAPGQQLVPLLALLFLTLQQATSFFTPQTCRPATSRITMASSSSTTTSSDGMVRRLPRAPLPPPILSNVPGTWAYDTMSRRVREDILQRIYEENNLDDPSLSGVRESLDQLRGELSTPSTSPLRPIEDQGAPDLKPWAQLLEPYLTGKGLPSDQKNNWLDAPWLLTEFYFYRRVAWAFRYFQTKYDPFHVQKRLGLEGALELTKDLTKRAAQIGDAETALRFGVFASLWGNKMDLSLWPSQTGHDNKAQTFTNVLEASSTNLLADDFPALSKLLQQRRKERVDIVVDNAGFELITDLILADCLIEHGLAAKVVFHTKGHPTFVSDAMDKDVRETVDYLRHNGVEAAQRWARHLEGGKWELHSHTYWCQPYPFWEMPLDVVQDLQQTEVCFVKGDANYRRLLGDRPWDLSLPFDQVCGYFPTALCPLRTLKAELGCGMVADKVEWARGRDPDTWMVTGKYGVIQLYDPKA